MCCTGLAYSSAPLGSRLSTVTEPTRFHSVSRPRRRGSTFVRRLKNGGSCDVDVPPVGTDGDVSNTHDPTQVGGTAQLFHETTGARIDSKGRKRPCRLDDRLEHRTAEVEPSDDSGDARLANEPLRMPHHVDDPGVTPAGEDHRLRKCSDSPPSRRTKIVPKHADEDPSPSTSSVSTDEPPRSGVRRVSVHCAGSQVDLDL
jgi:hypothetical protein